jgi:hypothetical protein
MRNGAMKKSTVGKAMKKGTSSTKRRPSMAKELRTIPLGATCVCSMPIEMKFAMPKDPSLKHAKLKPTHPLRVTIQVSSGHESFTKTEAVKHMNNSKKAMKSAKVKERVRSRTSNQ